MAKSVAKRASRVAGACQVRLEFRISNVQGFQRSLLCIRRRKRPPDAAIMRASQLDAARLDTELAAMLKEQFMKIFSFFQPRVISAFQPELTLILELLVGFHWHHANLPS